MGHCALDKIREAWNAFQLVVACCGKRSNEEPRLGSWVCHVPSQVSIFSSINF